MPNRDTPFRFPSSQRNQFVLVEQRAFGKDFAGAPFSVYEETLPQGSPPDVGTFGVFEPYVYNERNHTQSRHRFVQIDVNAAAITFRFRTADDGSLVKETREVVPVGTALPDSSLNLLNATRARMDQNHEMLVTETLESFPQRVNIEQANQEFGGLDIQKILQRVEANSIASGSFVFNFAMQDKYLFRLNATIYNGSPTYVGVDVWIDPLAVVDDFSNPNEIHLKAGTTWMEFFVAVKDALVAVLVPLGFTGNFDDFPGQDATLRISHFLPGPQNLFTVAMYETDTLPITSATIVYPTVIKTGTGSYLAVGTVNTDGYNFQAETEKRGISETVDVVTPAGPEQITLRDWVPSVQASQVMKKVEVVGTNDNPSATYLDVAIQDKKISYGKKLRTRFYVSAWQDFVDYEVEPETNEAVEITRRIRDKASYVYGKEARVEIEAKQLDSLRVLETRKTLSSAVFGKSYKTTRNIQYRFPGWLAPGDEYYIQTLASAGAYSAYTISGFNEKPGQVLTVPAEVITTYHPNRPLAPEVFQFYTSSFSAQVGFNYEFMTDYHKAKLGQRSLSFNGLITNSAPVIWKCVQTGGSAVGFTISVMTRTDPTWVGFLTSFTNTLEKSIPESVPNASVYVSMMLSGYRVLVGVEIEQWKYNLWKQTRTYIKIPNLITPGLAGL